MAFPLLPFALGAGILYLLTRKSDCNCPPTGSAAVPGSSVKPADVLNKPSSVTASPRAWSIYKPKELGIEELMGQPDVYVLTSPDLAPGKYRAAVKALPAKNGIEYTITEIVKPAADDSAVDYDVRVGDRGFLYTYDPINKYWVYTLPPV